MTMSVWPGIFAAMTKGGFAANAIQNSVRELNLLEALLAGRSTGKELLDRHRHDRVRLDGQHLRGPMGGRCAGCAQMERAAAVRS